MELDLPLMGALVIAIAVAMYVLLDGFDLGIGILFPFARRHDRDVMMNTVAPIWDGNETWLILGGGGMMGLFPVAYGVLLEALYLPLIAMLLGLVFRGVSFEFRFTSRRRKLVWDVAFAAGSIVATFAQGLVLGRFIQGTELFEGRFAGGAWDWIDPFSVFCGVALMIGYAALGAAWLVFKTEGELQAWCRGLLRPLIVLIVACFAIVSVWTPAIHAEVSARWFVLPNFLLLAPIPLAALLCAWRLWRVTPAGHDHEPFLLLLAIFLLAYAGLGISLFPAIVPPDITIWQAASPHNSLVFMLVGLAVLVPVIIGYNAWSWWIFRGKVTADSGYH